MNIIFKHILCKEQQQEDRRENKIRTQNPLT